ncbi:surfeit locus protein 6-domain-containing protein [Gorgonomyces haynaldii]|nr:surfeit locus protein 6-domain-containing protein [Gorgonomyces haynaldii]
MLAERLSSHSEVFDNLVKSIPPRFYLPQEQEINVRYMHNKRQKAPKQEVKEKSKKAKKLKLDPAEPKNVVDMQATQPEPQRVNTQTVTAAELQQRLKNKLEELRKTTGVPKSRGEMIEKRQKQEKKHQKKRKPDTTGMEITPVEKPVKKEEKESSVVFGKLDFGEEDQKKKKIDALGLLKKAQAKKEKLQELKETDAEKAQAIIEKEKWSKVMKQATGEKLKDDIKLLKKTVKRKEQDKQKSSQEWKDREQAKQKEQQDRQKKRQENIQARIEQKKLGKQGKKGGVSKKTKKSKPRAGFK